jgi:PAS domain-containing protein
VQKTTQKDHLIGAGADAFSFDTLVHEVDAIVEDLRWLHLELTLRNRCNEILFDDRASVPALLSHALSGLCSRLGALELIMFVRDVVGFRIALREAEGTTPWGDDRTPWIDAVDRWFDDRPAVASVPQAVVNHYTVDLQPVTAVAMPVRVGRRHEAVLLVVVETSPLVPRVRKLLVGLSGSLALAMQYCHDAQGSPRDRSLTLAPLEPPHATTLRSDAAIARTAHLRGVLLAEVDAQLRVQSMNDAMARLLGLRAERAAERDLAELVVPTAEQRQLRTQLLETADGGIVGFRMRTADGTSIPTVWIVAHILPTHPLPVAEGVAHGDRSRDDETAGDVPADDATADDATADDTRRGHVSREHTAGQHASRGARLLVGTRVAQEVFDAAAIRTDGADDPMLLQMRLAKQYRFMMKYVPFPVLHLDAHVDVIRNANAAFLALLGSVHWEGVPLSDFGTLTVQEGFGDARPCILRLVSASGITITCRGIMTTLLLFGKPVREITLDPVDTHAAADRPPSPTDPMRT